MRVSYDGPETLYEIELREPLRSLASKKHTVGLNGIVEFEMLSNPGIAAGDSILIDAYEPGERILGWRRFLNGSVPEALTQGIKPRDSRIALSWSAVAGAEQLKGARCGANFVAELGEHFASDFELLRFALCPFLRGRLQTVVSVGDVSGSRLVEAWPGECCLEQALRFGQLCKEDFLLGNTAKFADQAEPGEGPDEPFRRVDLPRLHAVAVIVLKLVMIVVVPLAEGHDRHQPRVTGAAFGGVGALADVVAQRIDAKGTVLKDDDPRHPRNKKCAESRNPATPGKAKDRRKHKGDRCADPVNIAMLPNNQRILLQVSHVIERRERVEFEYQPSDMGMKEAFGDAIRVFIVIDMLVVGTVFTGPEESRVLKGPCTEDQREKSYDPVRLESQVREESMVADRNGKSARAEHDEEERDLEPIDSEEKKIGGYRGQREE